MDDAGNNKCGLASNWRCAGFFLSWFTNPPRDCSLQSCEWCDRFLPRARLVAHRPDAPSYICDFACWRVVLSMSAFPGLSRCGRVSWVRHARVSCSPRLHVSVERSEELLFLCNLGPRRERVAVEEGDWGTGLAEIKVRFSSGSLSWLLQSFADCSVEPAG